MKKYMNRLNLGGMAILLCFISFLGIQVVNAKPRHPLEGNWTMVYKNGERSVVCYKLLMKDGRYVNLKSTDWEGKHFEVTRQGKYTIGSGQYVEHLMEEHGTKCFPPVTFLLNYEFVGKDTVKLTFRLDGQQYEEIWHKTKKAPRYQ